MDLGMIGSGYAYTFHLSGGDKARNEEKNDKK